MFTPNTQPPSPVNANQQSQTPAATTGTNSSSNSTVAPDARNAMNTMKHEIAGELGINLKQGYNGDLTSRQAGYIGGYMVKRMIDQQKQQMSRSQF